MNLRFKQAFRTGLATLSGLGLAALLHSSSASADQSLLGKVYHHQPGSGLKFYGAENYCNYAEEPRATLRIHDLKSEDFYPSTLGESGLLLQARDGHDTIFVRLFSMRGEDCAIGIRTILFDDGTSWRVGRGPRLDIDIPLERSRPIDGTRDVDTLNGTSRSDTIAGYAGNDVISGFEGDDVLEGGPGDDRIYGDENNDWLVGGDGNDDLFGGLGDDTYLFETHHGYDVIDDISGAMTLIFDSLSENDVTFARDGNDLYIKTRNPEDLVKIRNYYINRAALDAIQFDGVLWTESDIRRRLPR